MSENLILKLNMESPEITSEVFQKLQQDSENLYCFDCGSPNADYASTNHGIFLCSQCAGNHLIVDQLVYSLTYFAKRCPKVDSNSTYWIKIPHIE
ncbi:unnamed protein product [Blepharisma stoltei]|uniref:Arf-GAP domain-containing protein n=1 Tax=Blepharisma stoltei TaxID=1481888 RepID=A0AAU9K5M1_9CILI|nr:unnamed protein product [Blepharisma stoltei]